jgi:hypothetical protein
MEFLIFEAWRPDSLGQVAHVPPVEKHTIRFGDRQQSIVSCKGYVVNVFMDGILIGTSP